MQLKMVPIHRKKFEKNTLRSLLISQTKFIKDIFVKCGVPDSIEDKTIDKQYLLTTNNVKMKRKHQKKEFDAKQVNENGNGKRAQDVDELQQRIEIMKNKMASKKSKPSNKALKKKELKRLKKENLLKKRVISIAKSNKNEKIKEHKQNEQLKTDADKDDNKDDVKMEPIFNEEGKMVFSRFDFAARKNKGKKSKKEKVVKDKRQLLKNIKKQKKEIKELVDTGAVEKVEEIKKDLAWRKAFDRTEGKKVKDNENLLYKSLKNKKSIKKKSKKQWKEREEKVKKDIEGRQQKRQENINKKKEEKKKNKLKKMAKRGRIIPGYG